MTKFPFRVTLLIWLVLSLTAWSALRVWTTLAWKDVLLKYSPQPSPLIITISSAAWLIVGLLSLWGIWQNQAWTSKLLLGATAGYTVWYWGERLIWQSPHPNWLFAVIVNLAIIIFIFFSMGSMTREAYERKIENPTIK
jgi:hypothetical protein